MHLASERGHISIVQILIGAHADIRLKDKVRCSCRKYFCDIEVVSSISHISPYNFDLPPLLSYVVLSISSISPISSPTLLYPLPPCPFPLSLLCFYNHICTAGMLAAFKVLTGIQTFLPCMHLLTFVNNISAFLVKKKKKRLTTTEVIHGLKTTWTSCYHALCRMVSVHSMQQVKQATLR